MNIKTHKFYAITMGRMIRAYITSSIWRAALSIHDSILLPNWLRMSRKREWSQQICRNTSSLFKVLEIDSKISLVKRIKCKTLGTIRLIYAGDLHFHIDKKGIVTKYKSFLGGVDYALPLCAMPENDLKTIYKILASDD